MSASRCRPGGSPLVERPHATPSPVAASHPVARLVFAIALLAGAATAAHAQDKTPQPITSRPAVELSAAQRADIEAKRMLARPAPAAAQPGSPVSKLEVLGTPPAGLAAPLAPAPVSARAILSTSPDAPAPARPVVAPVRAWSVSPALGTMPRPEWGLPAALAKPPDQLWIGSPAGGRQVPVTPRDATPPNAGGGR
jgi:hypothetical protein